MTGSDVVVQVVTAIAEVEGVSVDDLDWSLDSYVDTDTLTGLVAMDRGEWELTVFVAGHEVTLDSDGWLRVDGELERRLGDGPERDF